ncbi:hypothetical protein MAP00_008889 [Monascus purpureus]|nr:hypothetical protein MAP00_008889 [Monascus purpureus]
MFGLTTLSTAFVRNYAGLLSLRLLLGIAESGILPGCAYLVSSWYTRKEGLKRFSFYLSAISLSSVFGGLLAAAIGKLDGACGLSGWRWLFVIEGSTTCILGIVFFFAMTNFPEDAKWLTDEERKFITARLEAEQGSSDIEFTVRPRDIWNTLKDPMVVMMGLIHLSVSVPGNMAAYFAPTIVESLGSYSPIQTQLHTAPVWLVASALSLAIAYVSDRIQHRYVMAMVCSCIVITGFSILLAEEDDVRAQYGALFLAVAGVASFWPVEICWCAMNLGGHRRRAIGSATQVGVGNIGGIISAYTFRTEHVSGFRLAYAIGIGFCCLAALLCTMYAACCWRQNRKRAAQGWGMDLSDREKAGLGDLSPSYRFMI